MVVIVVDWVFSDQEALSPVVSLSVCWLVMYTGPLGYLKGMFNPGIFGVGVFKSDFEESRESRD